MNIDDVIRSAGYRVTPQRRDFLEILSRDPQMDAGTLKDVFIERSHANLATFYRVLSDFRTCGFIHTLTEGGRELVRLCEEIRQNKIPSHSYELLHCHTCGNVQDHHDARASINTLSSRHEIHVEKCWSCK